MNIQRMIDELQTEIEAAEKRIERDSQRGKTETGYHHGLKDGLLFAISYLREQAQ